MLAKRFLAFGLSALLTSILSINSFAEGSSEQSKTYSMGSLPSNPEVIETMLAKTQAESLAVTTSSTFPDSVDLSTSPCFPPIGDQGQLGSCSAFAATYYQYSYEVNKLNNVTSTNNRVIYSPSWTFNLTCKKDNNGNVGSTLIDNYMALEYTGCLKLSDFPYNGVPLGYIIVPMQQNTQKIEALKTRVSAFNPIFMSSNQTIVNSNSEYLNKIKTKLNQGKVLTADTNCKFNTKSNSKGECVVYRSSTATQYGHSLTIVGYDDNMGIDVNNNGVIEPCEKGALKVVNSWGKDGYDDRQNSGLYDTKKCGYFWVLYDALNKVSSNTTNNWEQSLTGTRCAIFEPFSGCPYNLFYSIDVAHYDPKLVGEVIIDTPDREAFTLKINRTASSTTSWSDNGNIIISPYDSANANVNLQIAYKGSIFFDYDSLVSSVSNYYTGYNWHVSIENYADNTAAIFRILDGNGNTVTTDKILTNKSGCLRTCQNVNLRKGDLNYDNKITSKDVELASGYVSSGTGLSSLQKDLADYNNDGVIDNQDVILINMMTAAA